MGHVLQSHHLEVVWRIPSGDLPRSVTRYVHPEPSQVVVARHLHGCRQRREHHANCPTPHVPARSSFYCLYNRVNLPVQPAGLVS